MVIYHFTGDIMTKKKVFAIVLPIVAAILITAIVLICTLLVPHLAVNKKLAAEKLPAADETALSSPDKIHFLSTGGSDAILLESNGHFALVDAAEDSDNPRGFPDLELEGYEQKVLAYLKKVAADENGKVHLDFVLGTHSHSDHIGGFDTIILDPDVTIDCAYLKPYDAYKIRDYEKEKWDNQEVYDQMKNALKTRNVRVYKPLDTPFTLGNFTITLFNVTDPITTEKVGENDQSLGVLVEKNGTRVFLAGDIDNLSGDEDYLGPQIGKVDLLKVGHHSHNGSSSSGFIKHLAPKICVITNIHEHVNHATLDRFERICHPEKFLTPDKENGVLAVIGDNGQIDCYGQIHG